MIEVCIFNFSILNFKIHINIATNLVVLGINYLILKFRSNITNDLIV